MNIFGSNKIDPSRLDEHFIKEDTEEGLVCEEDTSFDRNSLYDANFA